MERKKVDLGRVTFQPTDYPGVVFLVAADGTRHYYIRYRDPSGKAHFEKAVVPGVRMTAAKADGLRKDRMRGKDLPNRERREAKKAALAAEVGRWTVKKLWEEYLTQHPDLKGKKTDENRYELYLKNDFGGKEPRELVALDVDRLRVKLSKTKEPATVRNVLELLRRIVNFGVKRGLCPPLPFRITMPKVDNIRTEDLAGEQMDRLLKVLREGIVTGKDGEQELLDPDAREMMLLALFSGLRRGEIFRLTWEDVDFQRGFITIRAPKGGTTTAIPMTKPVQDLLKDRPRVKGSPYVFPGRKGRQRVDAAKHFRAIRKAAELPESFRPLHGLRHAFASRLASSGEVDLYTLQRLMTHKSPLMTQRYAHLTDAALRRGADVMSRIVGEASSE